MPYCSSCGFNNLESVNFCTKCGVAMHSNVPAQMPQSGNSTGVKVLVASVKKELDDLYKGFISLFVPTILLMKYQSEGGWDAIFSDVYDKNEVTFILVFFVIFMGVFIGLFHLLLKVQAINKGKDTWALVAFILLLTVEVLTLGTSKFSLFNWADWFSEVLAIVQLTLCFLIWKKIKDN